MFITAKSTSNKTAETKTPAEAQTKVYIFENNSRKIHSWTYAFKHTCSKIESIWMMGKGGPDAASFVPDGISEQCTTD